MLGLKLGLPLAEVFVVVGVVDAVPDAYTPEKVCLVCTDERKKVAALVPCGHNAVCFGCAEKMKQQGHPCPICRQPIHQPLELYDVFE